MNELITKLLSGKGKLSLLLIEAREFAVKHKNVNLISFIDKELNGYSPSDIPEYRKINAELVATIIDSYGRVQHEEYPIDFSKISDQLGVDLSNAYMPDGISFIEISLENISKNSAIKPLPVPAVKMLNDIFNHNNPHLRLSKAGHKFNRASIDYILIKVRQDLILELQKMNFSIDEKINPISIISGKSEEISVFVTYAWENEEHNDNVVSFVEFLINEGYKASMDKKESQKETATNFNKMMIQGIQNSDKVIVILSKKYKQRADSFEGGVGMEFSLIIEDIKENLNKYIFVSFSERSDLIIPTAIKGRDILDLKEDQNNKFNNLFAKLQNKNIINFSEVKNENRKEVEIKKIKPFKL